MSILPNEINERYVLLTRPEMDSLCLADEIQAKLGRSSCIAPMLQIEYAQNLQCPDISSFTAILFTSAHAVEAVLGQYQWDLSGKIIFAIGDKTADKLLSYGVKNVFQANGTSEDLCRILKEKLLYSTAPVLHFCGKHVSAVLKEWIDSYALHVESFPVYEAKDVRQIPLDVQRLIKGQNISDVIFYSARTAKIFVALMKKNGLENSFKDIRVLCLSPSVVKSIEEFCWGDVKIAKTPSTCAILDLLNNLK